AGRGGTIGGAGGTGGTECAGGVGGAAYGRAGGGGPAGRGTPPPLVSRDSYVPSVSMNPRPLTSQVAASVPPSI
ncbi:hypothetical protein, partial [Streptomyces sp. SID5770]|uniref:hypothetical protein n=1 Tax=Streptomyces sp. SID5770 TaxID=2690308 RepID=UPI001F1E7A8D